MEAFLSLMESYDCNVFLLPAAPPIAKVVEGIRAARPMDVIDVPDLSFFLDTTEVARYPWTKSFEAARYEPFVALHTSGSTGLPKPVIMNHGTMTTVDAYMEIPELQCSFWRDRRVFAPFPLFHAAGLGMPLIALLCGSVVVMPPPVPLTAQMVDEVHQAFDIGVSLIPPAILVELAGRMEYLDNLSKCEYVVYGGGPLPKDVGDIIATRTHLMCSFGSSEAGWYPVALLEPEDWQYLKSSPALGVEMRPTTDDLYELVMVHAADLDKYQAVFSTFPSLSEYNTKDVFSKHATKEGLWLCQGRSDDIIVFSTGEKLNSISMEDIINGHPAVKSALICGQGRFQAALLVEAEPSHANEVDKEKFVDTLWPVVQRANIGCPTHGRILKDMIVMTDPAKPMLRAGKSTVQRKLTLDLYRHELDALYDSPVDSAPITSNGSNGMTADHDQQTLKDHLLNIVHEIQGLEAASTRTNLVSGGLDSLGVLTLLRKCKSAFLKSGASKPLTARDIYEHPSVDGIVSFLFSSASSHRPTSVELMQKIFQDQTYDMPTNARPPKATSTAKQNFLLTGSTGSLGSYVLHNLIESSEVSTVICLNRSDDAEIRQQRSMKLRGLTTDFAKVTFIKASLHLPYLGLKVTRYLELLQKVTHIVHNAWQVDFNVTLQHLADTHIEGVRRLIDFSVHSSFGAFIFFVSSQGAVANYGSAAGENVVPEKVFEDWNIPETVGYAQSKFLAERILQRAGQVSGVRAAVCRVGQIAGPIMERGMWPKQEWFPSLIASSKYLGKLPKTLGPMESIDWVPVNTLGRTIVEMAQGVSSSSTSNATAVLHAVNPQRTTWASLMPIVQKHLHLDVVSFEGWVAILTRTSEDGTVDTALNPALKLVDFFQALQQRNDVLPELETVEAVRTSSSLGALTAVNGDWMQRWMQQWSF